MILLSSPNSNMLSKHFVCLQDNETGADIYVSLDTYNQCIRIAKEYEDDPEVYLDKAFGLSLDTEGFDLVIRRFMSEAPYPLNMLMPYVNILNENNPKIMTDYTLNPDKSLQDIYGYLHVLSQMIDFEKYTMFEEKHRQDIKASDFMYLNYEVSWKEFIARDAMRVEVAYQQPIVQVPVDSHPEQAVIVDDTIGSENDEQEDEEENDVHSQWAALFAEKDEPMPEINPDGFDVPEDDEEQDETEVEEVEDYAPQSSMSILNDMEV